MNSKRKIKLYNIIFPIYLLWLIPMTWIIVLPANFIIDSAVVLLTLSALKLSPIRIFKQIIIHVWGVGFLSDFIGSVFLFSVTQGINAIADSFTETTQLKLNIIRHAIEYEPFTNIFALLITVISIIISALFIYKFNLDNTLRDIDMEFIHKKRLSFMLAIFTAPYMLLIPAKLIF